MFYITIADADVGSPVSPYIIWSVAYLGHIILVEFEQNRMVWTLQNFEVFDKEWLTIFDKVLTSSWPFWKTFLWLKQLFDAKL